MRVLAFLTPLLLPALVLARPEAPELFCESYPTAPSCLAGGAGCGDCHSTPPSLNDYGRALQAELGLYDDFARALSDALLAVEASDSDGDGFSNREEILWGSAPADADSYPREIDCSSGVQRDGLNPCAYDPIYVFRRVMLDFCGRSPGYDELEELRAAGARREDVHLVLSRCLDSEWWIGRDGALWRLAHRKIRPLATLKGGANPGEVPLGDYEDDYNLFVWSQIDGHDARELLTAQFFVARRDLPTEYVAYAASVLEQAQSRPFTAAQRVPVDRRAGILTHRWFLLINTMFTAIPRTTAAQAYRSFLGLDLSRLEGLFPVDHEPFDYDAKGVQAPACAQCHSTLDPLSYPFSRYEGLGGGALGYNANRMQRFVPSDGSRVVDTPEAGSLLGEPVEDLVEWGEVAANSDAFARATVLDHWRRVFGEAPRADELETFNRLWQRFRGELGYSVEAMLHALIDTEVYGVP